MERTAIQTTSGVPVTTSSVLPRDGSAQSPEIVINEALTHTDLPQVDSIELYNSTETSVDVSGWWLTDNNNQHAKFQIPSGSVIAAGSYLIFDETDFNPNFLTLRNTISP